MKPTNGSALLQEFLENGRTDDCPVFNTHAHYGPYGAIYFPRKGEADAMLAAMDHAGVRIALISSHAALRDPIHGNEVTATAVAAHPSRFRGYLVANPNYRGQTEKDVARFDHWRERGFVGFKLHPGIHAYPLTGPAYQPVFEFADARRIPVLSHTWGSDENCGTKQVREIIQTYPNVPFLAGHSCYGEWDTVIALANEHDNLYLELTAAYAVNGVLERMVAGAGANKILFGDDLPWFDPLYAVGCVLCAHINDDDRHAILHRNAESLFRL
jgi:predicted TIM-barrel fold metal-dependent hydrolase